MYSVAEIDKGRYCVKTTVKRYNDSDAKSKAYSYEVKEIELLDGTLGENASLPRTPNNSITAAKLLQKLNPTTVLTKNFNLSQKIQCILSGLVSLANPPRKQS